MFALVDRTNLNLVIMLGAGSDTLAIDVAGYQGVRMAVDTGPEGDGSDNITAHLQSLGRSGPKHVSRTIGDDGMDVFVLKALGYLVEPPGTSPIGGTEWVFLAT